jgi:hypothetical protein
MTCIIPKANKTASESNSSGRRNKNNKTTMKKKKGSDEEDDPFGQTFPSIQTTAHMQQRGNEIATQVALE